MKPQPVNTKTVTTANLKTAAKIVRAQPRATGVALRIVMECHAAGIPVSLGCALVEHESDFSNIFGADAGGLYPHQRVTKAKVDALVRHVKAGGISNGVGDTQLTSLGYILEANADGGAWKRAVNIATGIHIVAGFVHKHGTTHGLAAYNAGEGGWQNGLGYAHAVETLQQVWHKRLT